MRVSKIKSSQNVALFEWDILDGTSTFRFAECHASPTGILVTVVALV